MKKNTENENNGENGKSDSGRLFQLYLARVATVDTRSTMRTDVSPLFEAALKEAKTALAVFQKAVGDE